MTAASSGGTCVRARPQALLAFVGLLASAHAAAAPAPVPDVFVIGALHELHSTEESFPFETLRQLLMQIEPDVLVLEVRPDELAERTKTPGRPEYPAVVWPLLGATRAKAVAMEPGGEEFRRISGAAGASAQAARSKDAAGAALLDSIDASVESVLKAYWQEPADTHSAVTADLARAVSMLQAQSFGPAFVSAQGEWDRFMAARAVEAVLANPRKKVVVLGSFRNRSLLSEAIRRAAPERLVDMERYLRGEGGAVAASVSAKPQK